MILKICYDVLITNNILIKLETLLTLKNDQTETIMDGTPFPNEYEKKILKELQYKSKTRKEFLRYWIWLHPSLNKYVHEFKRRRKYWNSQNWLSTFKNTDKALPDFMIVGFPRCGTTSLWEYLSQHPRTYAPKDKELHFFSVRYDSGLDNYLLDFPTKKEKIKRKLSVFEASPDYILYPKAMERIKTHLPKSKMIILLRNPVEQIYSQYQKFVTQGFEIENLENLMKDDENRLKIFTERCENNIMKSYTAWFYIPYFSFAKYVTYIRDALRLFPKEQFLFLKTEDLKNNPQNVVTKCFEFLELDDYSIKKEFHSRKRKYATTLSTELRKQLSDYFKPFNEELEELLEMKLNWS